MTSVHRDELKQLDELLAIGNQAWLLGAGASLPAKLPLMSALTTRVMALAAPHQHKACLEQVKSALPAGATIEQILSHFTDYLAIAERSLSHHVTIGTATVNCDDLRELLNQTLIWISDTIRWGYVAERKSATGTIEIVEEIGARDRPLVSIDAHVAYIRAIFSRGQAGLADRRSPVKFFTTNYDTLLEDALSLCRISYWDGHCGGAVAYRSHMYGQLEPTNGYRSHVIKLHGSIDWHINDENEIFRVRESDLYPNRVGGRVLIYPQATKYLETQRDPFAAQFELFRRAMSPQSENVLAICGYGFGDQHINQEISLALGNPGNKTTVLVFARTLSEVLKIWQTRPWSNRVYFITEDGLFIGNKGPFAVPPASKKHSWWTFEGVTDLLYKGAEAFLT